MSTPTVTWTPPRPDQVRAIDAPGTPWHGLVVLVEQANRGGCVCQTGAGTRVRVPREALVETGNPFVPALTGRAYAPGEVVLIRDPGDLGFRPDRMFVIVRHDPAVRDGRTVEIAPLRPVDHERGRRWRVAPGRIVGNA